MSEVGKNRDQAAWIALLDAKYNGNPESFPYGELKKVLDEYNTIADFPASIFPTELMEAYPTAKVIATLRDEDSWVKSMESTIVHAHNSPTANKESPMRPLADRYHRYCWDSNFSQNGRYFSREYNRILREVVPRDRFLEYDVKSGWQPLCAFLNKQIPDVPFPTQDDWLEYKLSTGSSN